MNRQLKKLLKEEHLRRAAGLDEEDGSISSSSSGSVHSNKKNPFQFNCSDDDNDDDEAEESSCCGTDQPEHDPSRLEASPLDVKTSPLDGRRDTAGSIPSDQFDEYVREIISAGGGAGTAEHNAKSDDFSAADDELMVWTMVPSNFNPEVEMARISESSSPHQLKKSSTTIIGRHCGWLYPQSELLSLLEQSNAGTKWIGLDPKDEVYFQMKVNNERDGGVRTFDWVPSESYLRSFRPLELLISGGQTQLLMEFLAVHRFHPSANLLMADTFIQRNEFEAAHKFILNALQSFQAGLPLFYKPFKLDQHTRTPICQLGSVDEREIATALAIIADDLVVDWNLPSNPPVQRETNTTVDHNNKDRQNDIRQALCSPSLGNILFIKTVHAYAWSLLQRGCARTALEFFRLIHASTFPNNDHSHALLHMSDAAIRSRDLKQLAVQMFLLPQAIYSQCLRQKEQSDKTGHLLNISVDLSSSEPRAGRLDLILPSYALSAVVGLARKLRLKSYRDSQFIQTLEDINWNDFKAYEDSITQTLVEAQNGSMSRLVRAYSEKWSNKECHLSLLHALLMFPAFASLLCNASSHQSKAQFQAELLKLKHFSGENVLRDSEKEVVMALLKQSKAAESAENIENEVAHLLDIISSQNLKLIECYVHQSLELWTPMLDYLLTACRKLDTLLQSSSMSATDFSHLLRTRYTFILSCSRWYFQYFGVRVSEFDRLKPIWPDVLLNSSPETLGSSRHIQRRSLGGRDTTPLQEWWAQFQQSTGILNPNSDSVIVFLQALLPWSRLDVTGRC